MGERPTLHEIAAMPYSQTLQAVRQHYDPAWGKNSEEGEPIKAWRVSFDWEISGSFDEVIEAETEDEAMEEARARAADDASFCGELEISFDEIKPAKGPA